MSIQPSSSSVSPPHSPSQLLPTGTYSTDIPSYALSPSPHSPINLALSTITNSPLSSSSSSSSSSSFSSSSYSSSSSSSYLDRSSSPTSSSHSYWNNNINNNSNFLVSPLAPSFDKNDPTGDSDSESDTESPSPTHKSVHFSLPHPSPSPAPSYGFSGSCFHENYNNNINSFRTPSSSSSSSSLHSHSHHYHSNTDLSSPTYKSINSSSSHPSNSRPLPTSISVPHSIPTNLGYDIVKTFVLGFAVYIVGGLAKNSKEAVALATIGTVAKHLLLPKFRSKVYHLISGKFTFKNEMLIVSQIPLVVNIAGIFFAKLIGLSINPRQAIARAIPLSILNTQDFPSTFFFPILA